MSMAYNKEIPLEIPISFKRRLYNLVVSILKYPNQIVKRYRLYNYSIGEILFETGDIYLHQIRKRNTALVNFFVYLPYWGGVTFSIVFFYLEKESYRKFYEVLTSPLITKNSFFGIVPFLKRVFYFFTEIPLTYELYPFIIGYAISILGAFVLSRNRAFKEQKKISDTFFSLGLVDAENKPWKVTWTPDALLIEAYNCDPYAFVNKKGFWSTINFSPSSPKVSRTNMNKIIIYRKSELPQKLEFNVPDSFGKEDPKKKVKKPLTEEKTSILTSTPSKEK